MTWPFDVVWDAEDWEALLYAIKFKQCTPFIGAGACVGTLPLGRDIAESWAEEYGYPFQDTHNLVRVAQYVAIKAGPKTPRFKIKEQFAGKGPPDFNNPNEPHRVVAELRLPVYITTNYDDFMWRALDRVLSRDAVPRHPRREICRWYLARQRRRAAEREPDLTATPEEPVVYHLHGYLDDISSMVLTEDDYLDFLMFISETQDLIPPRIEQAFSDSSLLFMGYSLEDMNFKVLFRKLAGYMQRNEGARHVSVQLSPRQHESTSEQIERIKRQREYLERHFDLQKVKIYWGTCEEFARELKTKWTAFSK